MSETLKLGCLKSRLSRWLSMSKNLTICWENQFCFVAESRRLSNQTGPWRTRHLSRLLILQGSNTSLSPCSLLLWIFSEVPRLRSQALLFLIAHRLSIHISSQWQRSPTNLETPFHPEWPSFYLFWLGILSHPRDWTLSISLYLPKENTICLVSY